MIGYLQRSPDESAAQDAIDGLIHQARQISVELQAPLFEQLSDTYPDLTSTRFEFSSDVAKITQHQDVFTIPQPMTAAIMGHTIAGFCQQYLKQYTLPGFLEVNAGDHVVDGIGGAGGFACAALRAGAGSVTVFQPDPVLFAAAVKNTNRWPNANIVQKSVDSEIDAQDHTVDETRRIPDLIYVQYDATDTDFTKTLLKTRAAKIVVACSNTDTLADDLQRVSSDLTQAGYTVRVDHAVLFARKNRIKPHASRQSKKTIFAMWYTRAGQKTPPIVNICLNRWRALNPDYEVVMVSRDMRVKAVSDLGLKPDGLTIQAQADIVRQTLLLRHGGVWVDATFFPLRPLADWIDEITDNTGFAAYRNEHSDRQLMTGFLRGNPDSLLLQAWWRETTRYWQIQRSPARTGPWVGALNANKLWAVAPDGGGMLPYCPYLWPNYLFARMTQKNERLAQMWREPVRPARADVLQWRQLIDRMGADQVQPSDLEENMHAGPMQNLDHRVALPDHTLQFLANMPLRRGQ